MSRRRKIYIQLHWWMYNNCIQCCAPPGPTRRWWVSSQGCEGRHRCRGAVQERIHCWPAITSEDLFSQVPGSFVELLPGWFQSTESHDQVQPLVLAATTAVLCSHPFFQYIWLTAIYCVRYVSETFRKSLKYHSQIGLFRVLWGWCRGPE